MKKLVLKDIVRGTSTNLEAETLFSEINKSISKGETVSLSFTNITHVSSSFLNSSIGEIIDKFGFDYFVGHVKFTDCKANMAVRIKDYVLKYKTLVTT